MPSACPLFLTYLSSLPITFLYNAEVESGWGERRRRKEGGANVNKKGSLATRYPTQHLFTPTRGSRVGNARSKDKIRPKLRPEKTFKHSHWEFAARWKASFLCYFASHLVTLLACQLVSLLVSSWECRAELWHGAKNQPLQHQQQQQEQESG